MHFLSICGIVIAAVVLLICIILCLPVRFTLKIENSDAAMDIRILGYSLLHPKKHKRKADKVSETNQRPLPRPRPKKPGLIQQALQRKWDNTKQLALDGGVVATAKAAFGFLKSLLRLLKKGISHLAVDRFALTARPAGNAAAAALEYGALCAVIYPAVAALKSKLHFRENAEAVQLQCDFEAEESYFLLDFAASLRLIYCAAAILRAWRAVKQADEILEKAPEEKERKKIDE